ncbi:MAG: ATP-binding protein [Candidatus Accumulibacter propinquus]|jgi:predicted ATP-binding protein involved in virulence|uniref:AAA family ATPase n=1 Tax=Candidatus Accumulibacter propinquus TaxID=2954380 RepID=UPI002FC2C8E7
MQIKTFEVIGLMGSDSPLRLNFNSDLNIITGRNGSGKTSVLKLLWYILSGNILLALKEVNFKKATLQTTDYECTVYRLSTYTCRVDWKDSQGEKTFEDLADDEGDVIANAEDQADRLLSATGSSVFLPTFRRIEGGFTLNERAGNVLARVKGDIEESLVALSKKLTKSNHVFVSALSTADIVALLVRQYTDLSELYNRLQQNTSQEIIKKIKEFKLEQTDTDQLGTANRLLDEIRLQIEGMEGSRESIMRPLEAVRGLAMRLFRHSGIKLGKNLSFGDAANAINSDALSAGEKQMLSFIAYNAFYSNAVVVIDEPELSLHVDWQRQLFPILLGQQATNQFVIATHSPFIYSNGVRL